jgi:hypothetical protein
MKTWFYINSDAGFGSFSFAVRSTDRDSAIQEFKTKFPDAIIAWVVTR